MQQANTHSLHTQKHATQNHISSQVKLDNSHNATDTSKKSVSKHSLHTQNRDVSTSSQHDENSRHSEGVLQSKTTEESKNIRCFAYAQHDKKHFGFLNKSNSTHNDNSHNLSYSEIPNNLNSDGNSFQNGNTCMLSLQHCQLQIQTAKTMLQQALQ